MTTQIQISDGFWKFLNDKKQKGETFEDILLRLLKINKEIKNEKS